MTYLTSNRRGVTLSEIDNFIYEFIILEDGEYSNMIPYINSIDKLIDVDRNAKNENHLDEASILLNEFKNKFKDSLEYEHIIKPEICDKLTSTENFRNQWASQDNLIKKKNLKAQKDAKLKQAVVSFKNDFAKMQGRDPVQSEIIDNLKDKIDIKTLNAILDELYKEAARVSMSNVELPV